MTFDDLIASGWSDHDRDTPGVAARLEQGAGLVSDAGQAAKFTRLVTHAVGQHLKDWPRAGRICSAVVERFSPDDALAPALGDLAVAHYLSGQIVPALRTEARALAAAGPGAQGALVKIRMLVAEALSAEGRTEEALALYRAALDLSGPPGAAHGAERTIAVVSNNIASALLERPARSGEEDEFMTRAAEAARAFWLKAGDWRNDERSDYLLALVANARGRPEEAIAFAERGLATIEANGEERVD